MAAVTPPAGKGKPAVKATGAMNRRTGKVSNDMPNKTPMPKGRAAKLVPKVIPSPTRGSTRGR